MGMYLDSKNAYALYKKETGKPYFIDKSRMLKELIVLAGKVQDEVCITRPRRFGKTVAANMTAAFFPGLLMLQLCFMIRILQKNRNMYSI